MYHIFPVKVPSPQPPSTSSGTTSSKEEKAFNVLILQSLRNGLFYLCVKFQAPNNQTSPQARLQTTNVPQALQTLN